MLKHPELTERRILKAVPAIADAIYRQRAPVEIEVWHVGGEPVPYEMALHADYKPFSVGDAWGPAWDTTWFRIRGQVPAAWVGNEVVVLLRLTDSGHEGFTAEGLIYAEGRVMRALNINRSEIEVVCPSLGCEMFEFYIEAAANVADLFGAAVQYSSNPTFTLAQAELATVDRSAFDFYYDFKIAAELMAALPAESQRRGELRYALNESMNLLDITDPGMITNARHAIAGVLAKKNGDTAHQLSAIGHAHMDTAWLWPLRETIRKCARTFSTAIDYMDRYPEYIFGCSQAQQYAWMSTTTHPYSRESGSG